MTANLDRLLEPGETVAFRARGRSLVRIWFSGCIVIVSGLAFAALINARGFQAFADSTTLIIISGFAGALALLGGVVFAFEWRRQRRNPDEVLITNRRVLFTDSDWDSKVETMALSEVERISWSAAHGPGALDVIGAERTIRLPVMRQADALAGTLAAAADRPRPQPVGRMAVLDLSPFGLVVTFGGAFFVLASTFETLGLLPPADTSIWDWTWTAWTFTIIAMGTALASMWFLGYLPSKLLTATVMRPIVTAEQMEAGLCAGQDESWRIWAALKWASLLYGRRLSYVSEWPEPTPPSRPVP